VSALPDAPAGIRRVGHKGAADLVEGNTIASFERAVEIGVDMIEFDVLRLRDGAPELPAADRSPLVVAHDWDDAAVRPRLTLEGALDAFTRPPLDRVEIDCDLKLPGREEELVAALGNRDLLERAMVSTMYVPSLNRIAALEPRLRLGWTYPLVTRPWDRRPLAKPAVSAARSLTCSVRSHWHRPARCGSFDRFSSLLTYRPSLRDGSCRGSSIYSSATGADTFKECR